MEVGGRKMTRQQLVDVVQAQDKVIAEERALSQHKAVMLEDYQKALVANKELVEALDKDNQKHVEALNEWEKLFPDGPKVAQQLLNRVKELEKHETRLAALLFSGDLDDMKVSEVRNLEFQHLNTGAKLELERRKRKVLNAWSAALILVRQDITATRGAEALDKLLKQWLGTVEETSFEAGWESFLGMVKLSSVELHQALEKQLPARKKIDTAASTT